MEAILSGKYRATSLKEIWQHFKLRPGDRFKFFGQPDGTLVIRLKIPMSALKGSVPKLDKPVSVSRVITSIAIAAAFCVARPLSATSCAVTTRAAPSEGEKAYLSGDYKKAADLYQTALATHPADPDLTVGLVQVLLHEQKVQEAAAQVDKASAAAPNSAALLSLRGEVELREGKPWLATKSAVDAFKLDPCYPRNHLLLADLERLNSLYASSRKDLELAHELDPADPEIRSAWIGTLPLKDRIAEAEAYLASGIGNDEEETRHLKLYLGDLKKLAEEPHKACHLVSPSPSAEIPFVLLMHDATHIRAFGLAVRFNGHAARLQIDTGASGLLVSRSVAEHAGLKPFSQTEMGGVGDHGYKPGYNAYADSIQIGGLEFQDCRVSVLDTRNVLDDVDGLVGMDVFSRFLVTLDFPTRKLLLGPLPLRPGESPAAAEAALKTDEEDPEASEETSPTAKEAESDKAKTSAQTVTTPPAGSAVAILKPAMHGPYNRYVAPEMKSYTPVYRIGHQLILPVSLNSSQPRLFLLDTGAWTTSISPETAREVSKLHFADNLQIKGLSGAVEKVYVAEDITFHFANLAQKAREVVSFDTSNFSKSNKMEISGFIGATTLEQLTLHIDYRDGLVKFDYDPSRGYRIVQ